MSGVVVEPSCSIIRPLFQQCKDACTCCDDRWCAPYMHGEVILFNGLGQGASHCEHFPLYPFGTYDILIDPVVAASLGRCSVAPYACVAHVLCGVSNARSGLLQLQCEAVFLFDEVAIRGGVLLLHMLAHAGF